MKLNKVKNKMEIAFIASVHKRIAKELSADGSTSYPRQKDTQALTDKMVAFGTAKLKPNTLISEAGKNVYR